MCNILTNIIPNEWIAKFCTMVVLSPTLEQHGRNKANVEYKVLSEPVL